MTMNDHEGEGEGSQNDHRFFLGLGYLRFGSNIIYVDVHEKFPKRRNTM